MVVPIEGGPPGALGKLPESEKFESQEEYQGDEPAAPAGVETEWSQDRRHEGGAGQPSPEVEEGR